jgi:hypothetical protein
MLQPITKETSSRPKQSTGTRDTDLPPPFFSNFLFTNLFSIKFLYFFIISSLFPYFNLFVSIFIQSYANIKLHVSTLYRKFKGGGKSVPRAPVKRSRKMKQSSIYEYYCL